MKKKKTHPFSIKKVNRTIPTPKHDVYFSEMITKNIPKFKGTDFYKKRMEYKEASKSRISRKQLKEGTNE